VPDIGDDEKQAVLDTLESGWLSMGPRTRRFEEELSRYTGARHTVAVNSGTSALLTALLGYGIGPGDEVLVPTYTFAATASAVIALGAKPVLIDCDAATFNVGPPEISAALRGHPGAKALICVDVAGLPCDLDPIRALAKRRRLLLLEDAAEAFAGVYKSTPLGNFDHLTVFSFHIAKQMTTVEGGAVQTNRDDLAEKMRLIRSHGEGPEKYVHVELGLNFRPTDLQAAIGLAQLKKTGRYFAIRDRIVGRYKEELGRWLTFQHVPQYATRPTWMILMVLARTRSERDRLNAHLRAHGVDTRIPWPPIHRQPYFIARFGRVECPVADRTFERALSLPIGNAIRDEDVTHVIATVKSFFQGTG